VAPTPPKQETKPAPEQPRQMSYEEFVREHGQPKTRPPRQTTTRPAPTRSAPRLDTRFSVDVSDAIRSPGSLSGSSDAARTAVNIYVAGLNDLLKEAWNNPQLALTTVVEFDVAPSGRISNVRITSKSGNAAFDESVLAAFRQVPSGGPTPEGRALELRFRFNGVTP
jgi:TonB family protein